MPKKHRFKPKAPENASFYCVHPDCRQKYMLPVKSSKLTKRGALHLRSTCPKGHKVYVFSSGE